LIIVAELAALAPRRFGGRYAAGMEIIKGAGVWADPGEAAGDWVEQLTASST
jgi:hypothetical protein